jgi:hypothetical protein
MPTGEWVGGRAGAPAKGLWAHMLLQLLLLCRVHPAVQHSSNAAPPAAC